MNSITTFLADDSGKSLEVVSIAFTAIATVVIAYYSWQSHRLSKQLKDLFQAIVVSNLVNKGSATTTAIREFKQHYNGKTKIFDD